jgi:hypothetical protein
MRIALALLFVVLPSIAFAQKKVTPEQLVEQSVRKALTHGKWNGKIGNLATGAVVIDRDGRLLQTGDLGAAWWGGDLDTGEDDEEGVERPFAVATKVGKLDVWVDATRGIGWFRGSFEHTVTNQQTSDDTKAPSTPMSGVVIDAGGWKIAALVLTHPVADRKLIDTAAKGKLVPASGAPKLSGDEALAKSAAEWIAKGFSTKSLVGAKLAATGTAPGEVQSGAGVAKLVKAWDGLKLGATSIDARVWAKGTIGFVRADVLMPLKKGGKAAPLVLGAIALNDGTSWRWVSLQFATPVGVPRHGPPSP